MAKKHAKKRSTARKSGASTRKTPNRNSGATTDKKPPQPDPASPRMANPNPSNPADSYQHRGTKAIARPDVGTQSQFKKKKPPGEYRYDSSLAPELQWDGQNPAREEGEQSIAEVLAASAELEQVRQQLQSPLSPDETKRLGNLLESLQVRLQTAGEKLRRLGEPFLNWAGKAERMSFDVPTLPLFVHERLSTEAIIETLTGHRKQNSDNQQMMLDFFGNAQRSITDQVLRAYEYQDDWVNRMVLGDSLVVMNSLLHYEGMGGQVQMIYMDPPYGVKFGSNFQPFVRRRDVKHGDDDNMTREPEMVQAYRDTWELGLHSYLTYLRDRLMGARELLALSGSIFVQIGEENVHAVRVLLDEIFGRENSIATIVYKSAVGLGTTHLDNVATYILYYAKDKTQVKSNKLYRPLSLGEAGATRYHFAENDKGEIRRLSIDEQNDSTLIPKSWKPFFKQGLTSRSGSKTTQFPVEFDGQSFRPTVGGWRTGQSGMDNLIAASRIVIEGKRLAYKRFFDDFSATPINNVWDDISGGIKSRSDPKIYAVQTSTTVLQRCMLMTTDPGDLVLDPTCGSGTTAYVAEQWGRRWITADTSRVPLALARQRLLTATFPWYELKEDTQGPAGGFVYKRKQNRKGEETGGIVPHVTLKSIANNEPAKEEVLVDRAEEIKKITRVTGPFCVEATIPTPIDLEDHGESGGLTSHAIEHANFEERMIEILRRSPLLRLTGNRTVQLHNIRKPAKTLSLSAEAMVNATAEGQKPTLTDMVEEIHEEAENMIPLSRKPVGFVFGPENAAISEKLVFEAAREANGKNYTHLYVIGFAIQPKAREFIEHSESIVGVASTYVQATPDLMMGDLLKNMRSSQIFSVCGLPEIKIHRTGGKQNPQIQVELLGMDVFDPTTMDVDSRPGKDVPAWLLDSDYNDLCFHVSQAFFPRTHAWDAIKKALKGTHDESVWDHLSGTKSAPFEPGERNRIAVKVIDDRGNELMVVRDLSEDKRK